MALKVSGISLGVAGSAALLFGFSAIAIESHTSGGFVRKCHAMFLLVAYRAAQVADSLEGSFNRNTALN